MSPNALLTHIKSLTDQQLLQTDDCYLAEVQFLVHLSIHPRVFIFHLALNFPHHIFLATIQSIRWVS